MTSLSVAIFVRLRDRALQAAHPDRLSVVGGTRAVAISLNARNLAARVEFQHALDVRLVPAASDISMNDFAPKSKIGIGLPHRSGDVFPSRFVWEASRDLPVGDHGGRHSRALLFLSWSFFNCLFIRWGSTTLTSLVYHVDHLVYHVDHPFSHALTFFDAC